MGENTNSEIKQRVQRIRDLKRKGESHEALRLAEQLCREHPDQERFEYERVGIIVDQLLPHDGLAAATEYVKRFPSSSFGRLLLASANIRLNRGHAALEELDAAVALGAVESTLIGMRSRSLELAGKTGDALSLIGSGSDRASLRAKFELEQPNNLSDLDHALEELEKCGETAENLALYRSGWLANQRMFDEAENCVKRVISSNGPTVYLTRRLAEIEFLNGKRDSACARLEEVLAERPEDLFIRRSISWYYFWSGQFIPGARHLWLLLRYGVFGDPNKRK